MSWLGCIETPGRRLHVGERPDGRCGVWHYVDGRAVVLATGRVLGGVELVDVELVKGSEEDVEHLRRWLRRRLT